MSQLSLIPEFLPKQFSPPSIILLNAFIKKKKNFTSSQTEELCAAINHQTLPIKKKKNFFIMFQNQDQLLINYAHCLDPSSFCYYGSQTGTLSVIPAVHSSASLFVFLLKLREDCLCQHEPDLSPWWLYCFEKDPGHCVMCLKERHCVQQREYRWGRPGKLKILLRY